MFSGHLSVVRTSVVPTSVRCPLFVSTILPDAINETFHKYLSYIGIAENVFKARDHEQIN